PEARGTERRTDNHRINVGKMVSPPLINLKIGLTCPKISALEQFTYSCEPFWLVGVTKLLLKRVLRGHKSA
ncbi:MAG: hypothetical protein ABGZ24_07625, partial [Fuerstiella sp.]